MRKEKDKAKKILVILLSVFILSLFIYDMFLGKWSIISLISLYVKKHRAEKELAITSSEIVLLENEIDRLKNDNFYIEKVAREKGGMIKKGERRLLLPPPSNRVPIWKRFFSF